MYLCVCMCVFMCVSMHVCMYAKFHPRRGHENPEEESKYSFTLSLTSALDGGDWSMPRPGCFTPVKETRHLLGSRLGGSCVESLALTEISSLDSTASWCLTKPVPWPYHEPDECSRLFPLIQILSLSIQLTLRLPVLSSMHLSQLSRVIRLSSYLHKTSSKRHIT
jgi:hypothetical protein